ncbi:MAG: 3-hydroxyacyl-CoA dehydrogenase NAD-binding domain-containing protein, partial [Alphaproteobacteria bacterium]
VGVIGAGTIGAGWAALFLANGLAVDAWDPAPGAESRLRAFVAAAWPALERLGLKPGADPERLGFAPSPEAAVEGAGFVQESAPEREALKVELFARLDAAMMPEALLATSTSSLPVSRLQRACARPGRCVLGHPFNPPYLVPLVEVAGGEKTDPAAVEAAMGFYRALGKHPIRLEREIDSHIANRLQEALLREAVHLVAEGVGSVADVDAALAYGPGLRWALMGPFLTFHLAGGERGLGGFFEHFGPHVERNWQGLGAPRLTPELRRKLIAGVEAEAGGRPIVELAAARDACLVEMIEALARCRGKGEA